MASLTPAQLRVLEATRHDNLLHMYDGRYLEDCGPGRDFQDVTDDAAAVVDAGLIEDAGLCIGGTYRAELTATGRAVLGMDTGRVG